MKKLIASAITLFSATAASAGSVVFTAPEVVNIEEPASMGGSGAWLIPLIIAAIILLAIPKNNNQVLNAAR